VDPLQAREVLDVGAGIGFFARELLHQTSIVSAVCVDPGYEADSAEQVGGKSLLFRREVSQSTADLVLMMDVLEHVPDDVALLRDYVTLAPPGTRFVITVPAFAFLWSEHDVFLEHYRRYTLTHIERVARSAGLEVRTGCYFYGALFPLAAASRLAGRLRPTSGREPRSQMREFGAVTNGVFWAICRAELTVFRANRVADLTAFVYGVKP
jgi:SAM-dependent methyltransferase